MATTMIRMSSTMPTAVMIESSANTMSSTKICIITPASVACTAPPFASVAPSSLWCSSFTAL